MVRSAAALLAVLIRPSFAQAQEPQGMPGGRRVEDDVIVAGLVPGKETGKFVKGSDLRGAGSGELLIFSLFKKIPHRHFPRLPNFCVSKIFRILVPFDSNRTLISVLFDEWS